jgi:hypothetical protein
MKSKTEKKPFINRAYLSHWSVRLQGFSKLLLAAQSASEFRDAMRGLSIAHMRLSLIGDDLITSHFAGLEKKEAARARTRRITDGS